MQKRLTGWLALSLCAPLAVWSAEELKFPTSPSVAPKDAARTFHVLDGFEMQLIAAEPLVTDPVAVTYDEDGRAYVCEMNDYPYTDKEHHKHAQENPTDLAIGKVRLLTDTDGDGVFDKATVFAEGLSWPTGVACWKGGIFVTATPDVWYLKDTNGDGVADVRQKVFTGFKKLNVQAVMNNPIWGLDHRIYVAGGSNGGEIQRVPGSEAVMPLPADFKPLSIKRNDFSFDPSTGDVRLESGGARFGNTFDDWGNRFLCNIRNPCQHVVLPYRYLARNPYLVVPSALNDCAEAGDQLPVYRTSPPESWREFRAKRWVKEGSTLPKSELVGAGVVTSSAGITVYRGDAYPAEYRDFAFVADVAGNLFYRMKLVPDGVTFKAVQVDGSKNFCTSDDLWFRPVNFSNAPDGCLTVCDMYREVIEHPWSIPDDIHAAVDLLRGSDKGRLFRLAPKSFHQRATPKLSEASTAELVALLDHANAWHRETAQRLLFERQDKGAVELLCSMVKEGKRAQGRVAALWSLQAIALKQEWQLALDRGKGGRDILPNSDGRVMKPDPQLAKDRREMRREALHDSDPQVRAQAVEVLDSYYNNSDGTENWSAVDEVKDLRNDPSKRVRFVAALALGGHELDQYAIHTGPPLILGVTDIGLQDAGDPWLEAALLSSNKSVYELFEGMLGHDMLKPAQTLLLSTAGKLIAQTQWMALAPSDCFCNVAVCERLSDDQKRQIMQAMAEGMSAAGRPATELLTAHEPRNIDGGQKYVSRWQAESHQVLDHAASSTEDKIRAMRMLSLFEPLKQVEPQVLKSLAPTQPAELQFAALEALRFSQDPAVAGILIESWPKLTPALRDKAATLLLSRTDRIARLLDAIEAQKILPSQLSAATKATLGRQKTPALAVRIAKLIGDGSSSNRKAVIDQYITAMFGDAAGAGRSARITGDAGRGAKVYETMCLVCHRHLDRGNDVGPNLGTIKAWTDEQILTNVLDPNREVSPNFALYIVETNDGRTLSGLIASEAAGNLTLKRADGGTDSVLRSEIKSLTSPGISLMPEGLEGAITPQQMADLIAYLKAP
ncbi:PVC-type heme-binding CxxCH protein [Prosthecobacter vanneervenii]|uniref:Putative membrane-bound dehydrogenase-like protein n=1 Tax=Prosthecobacter vanneervenii TaxID=48466 RepID=A0A7W7YF93_9BACT|nr:PVC-type heme-binding CxxCH protein [Prosthecobacter vanneervenii]MBB5035054.1 putative membrane-bound dehydrogenase-like protein [Prosthecobacter vanneervenii]